MGCKCKHGENRDENGLLSQNKIEPHLRKHHYAKEDKYSPELMCGLFLLGMMTCGSVSPGCRYSGCDSEGNAQLWMLMVMLASAQDVLCWDCMAVVASLGWPEIGGLQWSGRAVEEIVVL